MPRVTWTRLFREQLAECKAVFLEHKYNCEDGTPGCKRMRLPAEECDGCRESEIFLGRGFAFQADVWWEADFVFVELCAARPPDLQ